MPREDRRIIFDFVEAYKAIYALSVQKEMRKPPPGVISRIAADTENDQNLKIMIENPQDNSTAQKEYSRDFLAAALMLYCRTLGIPLAKKSQKSVEFTGDSVVLRITI